MDGRGKGTYYIRILAAVYVLYVSYRIVKGILQGDEGASPWMLIAVAAFVVIAVALIITSAKGLRQLEEQAKAEAEQAALEASEEEPEEEDGSEESEPEESELQERKPKSIAERARLASQVEVPEGIIDEIETDESEKKEG